MESEWDEVRQELIRVKALGASYALVGNISHISLVREAGIELIGDFRLNITNRYTAALYRQFGVNTAILSPELTLPQARDIGGGVITLGRIPLMLTERCFIRENFGCNKCGKSSFTDRKGMKFPIMREWKHRNVIFNSAPTYMADKQGELRSAGITHEHYIFSSESATEILDLLRAAKEGKPLRTPLRRIGKR